MKKNSFNVFGTMFGDESKGKTVDYLARKHNAKLVIRYNGGPQAAHFVTDARKGTHCFSQFGSGTLIPGVKTYLSRYMVVDPWAILKENDALRSIGVNDALKRIAIDSRCPVVTPIHAIINQMQEISRGDKRHGSCGKGIGQTIHDLDTLKEMALFIGDLEHPPVLRKKLEFLWRLKLDLAEQLFAENKRNQNLKQMYKKLVNNDIVGILVRIYEDFIQRGIRIGKNNSLSESIAENENIIFEGAQGILLDPIYGFLPHVTKTRTTPLNVGKILEEASYEGRIIHLGVLRAYGTRHGAGPFPTKNERLERNISKCHNVYNPWQGKFRIGWLDLVLARYAIEAAGNIDALVVTNIDRLDGMKFIKAGIAYRSDGQVSEKLAATVNHFIEHGRSKIERIKPADLLPETRERLTGLLNGCHPVYKIFPGWKKSGKKVPENLNQYLKHLEITLNKPIKLISFGLTADDMLER